MAGTIFIFGLGYVGKPLGHLKIWSLDARDHGRDLGKEEKSRGVGDVNGNLCSALLPPKLQRRGLVF